MLWSFAMSQRHWIQNDAIMLVTTNTAKRAPVFADDAKARMAIEHLYRVQVHQPFFLYGFVIMPDHIHVLLCIPEPGSISRLMNVYKSGLTFELGMTKLWQPRFHARIIDNPTEALQYIHENPMKAGLVETPDEYPWSSASGRWDVTPLEMDFSSHL